MKPSSDDRHARGRRAQHHAGEAGDLEAAERGQRVERVGRIGRGAARARGAIGVDLRRSRVVDAGAAADHLARRARR